MRAAERPRGLGVGNRTRELEPPEPEARGEGSRLGVLDPRAHEIDAVIGQAGLVALESRRRLDHGEHAVERQETAHVHDAHRPR